MKSKPLHSLFKIALVLSIVMALTLSSLPQLLGNAGEAETTSVQAKEEISSNWLAQAQETIQQMEYHITWADEPLIRGAAAGFQAPNRAHNLRFYFQPDGVQVIQRDTTQPAWVWRLALAGMGRSGAVDSVGNGVLVDEANLITYQFGVLEQSLVNSELGLQQTITVFRQPQQENAAPLVLSQQVAEDFSMQRVPGGGVQISFNELPVLEYKLQNAVDASGVHLAAHLEVR